MRALLLSLGLASAAICLTGFDGCPNGEGEGEGDPARGEGEGEGEGQGGEGEGQAGEGEGEGEGDGTSTRSFECMPPAPPVVAPTSCTADFDCAVGTIGLDCCGSLQQTGVNAFAICGFMNQARSCQVAACDCAAHETRADDGSTATVADQAANVACVQGVCTTTFAP